VLRNALETVANLLLERGLQQRVSGQEIEHAPIAIAREVDGWCGNCSPRA